jgi:hypothetical protein
MIYTVSPINGNKLIMGYVSSNIGLAIGCSYVIHYLNWTSSKMPVLCKGCSDPTKNIVLLFWVLSMHILFALHLVAVTYLKMSNELWKWAKCVEFLATMLEFVLIGII